MGGELSRYQRAGIHTSCVKMFLLQVQVNLKIHLFGSSLSFLSFSKVCDKNNVPELLSYFMFN